MSFPNIPDINPYINITFEDAINLLLTSIALEEVSLSKLMDAETSKILCVLSDCKQKECWYSCKNEKCVLNDALLINKSVDNTIQNLIKMQMLLQFKLEKVKDMIPSTTTTSTSTTTTTTTCTRTTTTKCKPPCCKRCCLTGKGKGCVSNPCDEFYCHMATLKAFVSCGDIKNRSIRYSVEKDDVCLDFYASEHNIKIECPCENADYFILYGKGCVEKKYCCGSTINDFANFKLTICNFNLYELEFKIEITAESNSILNHRSGVVQVKEHGSTLKLDILC